MRDLTQSFSDCSGTRTDTAGSRVPEAAAAVGSSGVPAEKGGEQEEGDGGGVAAQSHDTGAGDVALLRMRNEVRGETTNTCR